MYGGGHLPQHQQRQPDQHYGGDHAQDYTQDWYLFRAFSFLLRPDDHFPSVLVRIDVHVQTVFVVIETAQVLVESFVGFDSAFLYDRQERAVAAAVRVGVVLGTALVHLAEDAVFEVSAVAGASWTFLAVHSRIVFVVVHVAHALAAHTFAVAATNLVVLWRHAHFGVLEALAGGPAVVRLAAALAAHARAVARAQLPLVAVAREVVALAERARYYLSGVFHLVALADATDAGPAVGAERAGGGVGGAAAALLLDGHAALRGALAALPEAARAAQAHAARRHALAAAHQRTRVVREMSRPFTRAIAQQLQLHLQTVRYTHRGYFE